MLMLNGLKKPVTAENTTIRIFMPGRKAEYFVSSWLMPVINCLGSVVDAPRDVSLSLFIPRLLHSARNISCGTKYEAGKENGKVNQ